MISIIIINYNTSAITLNCIRSVISETKNIDYEIVLVDNASTECDPDVFVDSFPGVKLVKSDKNLGFAKGNNLGIAHAKGDIILLLNSDTYFVENTLQKSLNQFNSLNKVGFFGVKMLFPDGRVQYTARKFRSVQWELLDLFRVLLYLLPYSYRSVLMLGRYFKADRDLECDWLNGAFLMFNRSLLNELPQKKLDERFFMYGEDHLWSYQVRQLGYKNYFYSGTSIVHINNASTQKEKRLNLLNTIYNNEIEIIRERLGTGIDFHLLKLIYGIKEKTRIFIKKTFNLY